MTVKELIEYLEKFDDDLIVQYTENYITADSNKNAYDILEIHYVIDKGKLIIS